MTVHYFYWINSVFNDSETKNYLRNNSELHWNVLKLHLKTESFILCVFWMAGHKKLTSKYALFSPLTSLSKIYCQMMSTITWHLKYWLLVCYVQWLLLDFLWSIFTNSACKHSQMYEKWLHKKIRIFMDVSYRFQNTLK